MNVSILRDPGAHQRQSKNNQYMDEANTTVVVTFDGVSKGVHSEGQVVVDDIKCLISFFEDTVKPLAESILTSGNRSVCLSRVSMQAGISSGDYQQSVEYEELAAVFHMGAVGINRILSVIRVITNYFELPLINEDYSQFDLTGTLHGRPLYVFHKTGEVRPVTSLRGYSDRYLKVEDDEYQQIIDILTSGEESILDDNRFIVDANASFFQGDYQTAIVLLQIQLEYELSKEMIKEGCVIPEKEGLGKKFIVPLVDAKKTQEWKALKKEWDNYLEWRNGSNPEYEKIDEVMGAWIEAYILRNEIVHEGKPVTREDAVEAFLAYMVIFKVLFNKMVFLPRLLSWKSGGTFG